MKTKLYSPNWLILPVVMGKSYPNRIIKLAEQLEDQGVSAEMIAERDGIVPQDVIQDIAFSRDFAEMIRLIVQSSNNPSHSTIISIDGDADDVAIPVRKLVKLLDKFFESTPTYILPNLAQDTHIIIQKQEDDEE